MLFSENKEIRGFIDSCFYRNVKKIHKVLILKEEKEESIHRMKLFSPWKTFANSSYDTKLMPTAISIWFCVHGSLQTEHLSLLQQTSLLFLDLAKGVSNIKQPPPHEGDGRLITGEENDSSHKCHPLWAWTEDLVLVTPENLLIELPENATCWVTQFTLVRQGQHPSPFCFRIMNLRQLHRIITSKQKYKTKTRNPVSKC